jgi:DNA-binding transcriptional LysR family regulator
MELESTRIFVKVIQYGSFSKAAEALRLPKSTVSRTVSRLEGELKTRLIIRTTRSLALTSAGRNFFESSLGPIQALEDARKALQGGDQVLSGTIRLTAPEDLGAHVITPIVGKLSLEYPGISFELNYTDEVVDLVKEGIDVAIRIGKLNPSRFKVKKLGQVQLIPVASPLYLQKKEKIRQPQDLTSHSCLTYFPEAARVRWELKSKTKGLGVLIQPRIVSNQMSSLLEMAVQGVGVALVPQYLCRARLNSGELVRVLPDWAGEGLPVSSVYPLGSHSSSRMKLISERLNSAIQNVLS